MAVSFTIVDVKFLVQQSFSLSLQLLRPAHAKVIETYEQCRNYNALAIVLLVRKIPKMKFLFSCTSGRQDLRRRKKYYRLEVQLAYLVNFAQLLLRFASHFTFSALQISLTLLWVNFFKNTYILFYFYLVLYLQLWLEVQHTQWTLPNFYYGYPHFTFLHSKMLSYTRWNHFLQE